MLCCFFVVNVRVLVEGNIVDIFIKMVLLWIIVLVGFIGVYCVFVLFVGENVLFVDGFKIIVDFVNIGKQIDKMEFIVWMMGWW